MKKYLLLLTYAALLLAGCAKELVSNGVSSRDRELTKVTFTASLDNGVATKAAVDGDGAAASVNRCIMEIYYGGELFAREYAPVNEQKKATFTVQVVSNRTYTVAFWADKVDDAVDSLATDKYYITNAEGLGLKAVALNGAYIGNDDARDAFAHCGTYTVAQVGSSWGNIKLKRPFAQINVITTDVATVAKVSSLKPEKVNLVLKNAVKTYNVLDSTAVAGSTGDLTYTANIYNWDANKTECTLSMDYIFAEKEKGAIDINWKAKKTGDADVEHAFAAVPYQRNYRTNIKGALLTTTGQWTVTVDSIWGSPEYDVPFLSASTIAEAQSYIAPETQGSQTSKVVDLSKATITTGDITGEDKIEFILKTTSPADMVNFTLPAIPVDVISAGCTGWKITYDEGYPTDNVNVTAPAGTNVIIQAPTSHVVLNGQTYGNIEARTGYGTLVVPQGVTINNLTVKKGWVEIHGTVDTLNDIAPAAGDSVYFRDCEGLSQTVFAKIKDDGFSFIHPDYVEKQNGNKWDIIPVAIPVTGVSLSLDKVALNVGKNKSLTATVLPEDASNKSVVWTSSNTDVATVDQSGKVTAVAAGSAEIIVTTVNQSKTDTCSVTVKGIPAGALGGEFSVSNDGGTTIKQVYFSQGNLKYVDGTPNGTWSFETKQYEFSTYPGNNDTPSDTYGLFGWGDAPKSGPVKTSDDVDKYSWPSSGAPDPWGSKIDNNGTWRTLSRDEWCYLFAYNPNTHTFDTSSPRYNLFKYRVTVCGKPNCVVLLPDGWHWDEATVGSNWQTEYNETTDVKWPTMEAAGAVCLPAAGYRGGSSVNSVSDYGYCWSSTAYDKNHAYNVLFSPSGVYPVSNNSLAGGCSVRLITECQ